MFEVINCWNTLETLINDEFIIDQLCDAELDYKTTKLLFQNWVQMVFHFGFNKVRRPKGLELIFSSDSFPVTVDLNSHFLPENRTMDALQSRTDTTKQQTELFLIRFFEFINEYEYVAIRKLGVVTVDKVYCLTINMLYSPTFLKNSKKGRVVKINDKKAIVEIYSLEEQNEIIEYKGDMSQLKGVKKGDVVLYWRHIPLLLPEAPYVPYWEDIKYNSNDAYYGDTLVGYWS
jgi:hypothetical protein